MRHFFSFPVFAFALSCTLHVEELKACAEDDIDRTLALAAKTGQQRKVDVLLREGADPDRAHSIDDTVGGEFPAVVYAALHPSNALFDKLVQAGADVNAQVRGGRVSGSSALHAASAIGQIEIVKDLVKKDININLVNVHGATGLHLAVEKGHPEIVLVLLAARALPNLQMRNGLTPLMIAAQKGDYDSAANLLCYGADPDIQDTTTGKTALMMAAERRELIDIVRLLLEAGANLDITLPNGMTATRFAAAMENEAIRRLLEKTMFERREMVEIRQTATQETDMGITLLGSGFIPGGPAIPLTPHPSAPLLE